MTTLDEVEIEGLIDPTFAIIAQHWESFNSEIQSRASSMVTKIMKTQPEMIREMVNTIPSLASIPVLSKAEGELSRLKATMDPKHRFLAYAQRCQKENATVVGRALLELSEYLSLNQSFLHTSALSEQPDPVIPQLVRSLLDACALFNETDPDIVIRSAQCLGMIGCLDPTKIEITVEVKEIFVLYNFRIAEEIREFVVFFIQEVLLKAFLATTDTRLQGILGFAIQELLHICGFTPANTLRRDYQQPDALYKRWIAIPESIRNTLNPFITSKYSLGPPPPLQPVKYPLYNPGISHTNWLRWFVLDLLAHCRGENATLIFRVSERIIRKQDITIPTFLLPFVALNIVVDGTREQREDIAKELLAILERPLPKDQLERENLILCSQVSTPNELLLLFLQYLRMSSESSTTSLDG